MQLNGLLDVISAQNSQASRREAVCVTMCWWYLCVHFVFCTLIWDGTAKREIICAKIQLYCATLTAWNFVIGCECVLQQIHCKNLSVWVSLFVTCRIGFQHMQWRILKGVTVICVGGKTKCLKFLKYFSLRLQIYWYTCDYVLQLQILLSHFALIPS